VLRSFDHYDYDAARLVARKAGQRVTVCLPARNEEATVGEIVATIREHLVERCPLVDELLVVDDHSTDDTARQAAAAGAKVVDAASVLTEHGGSPGKGGALWRSLHESTGDLVVWCDSDVTNFSPQFVVGLLGPLLTEPDIAYVKGFYRRPLGTGGDGGGRVTELVARPLLALLHPELRDVAQPLSGEYAGRRQVLEQVPFVAGYGVEVGLLIDLAARFGTDAMAQVDLGTRRHRNRSLVELGPQAMTIMQVALRRAQPGLVPVEAQLDRPDAPSVVVSAHELPPLLSVPAYLRRHHPEGPGADPGPDGPGNFPPA
jgi:glucosyl-3-phosphoglycerate synthase